MKCCLSSSSTFPLMMSVTSITAERNQGHWMNWATWGEGTPQGTEATVTQKRAGIISCGISEFHTGMEQRGAAHKLWHLSQHKPWKVIPRPQQPVWWDLEQLLSLHNPTAVPPPNFYGKKCNRIGGDPPQRYLPPRRVGAAPTWASWCCCPAAPSCPRAQSDTQNWSSLSSGLCCPGPTNSRNIRLLSNSWISNSISAGRRFAAQNLPSLCKPLTQSALRVEQFL